MLKGQKKKYAPAIKKQSQPPNPAFYKAKKRSASLPAKPHQPALKLCMFHQHGTCKFGSLCRFSHGTTKTTFIDKEVALTPFVTRNGVGAIGYKTWQLPYLQKFADLAKVVKKRVEEERELARAAAKAALKMEELPALSPLPAPRPERELSPAEMEAKSVARSFANSKREEHRKSIMKEIREAHFLFNTRPPPPKLPGPPSGVPYKGELRRKAPDTEG
jgi:hypothetical protein